jgi:hypothetical protein
MLNQYLNLHEMGRQGRTLKGAMQPYMSPLLSLTVASTKRTVLEISKHANAAEAQGLSRTAITSNAVQRAAHDRNEFIKYTMEFDYPLTIFLSFAVMCAIEAFRMECASIKPRRAPMV